MHHVCGMDGHGRTNYCLSQIVSDMYVPFINSLDRMFLLFSTAHRSAMSSPWSTVKTAFSQKSTRIAAVVHLVSLTYVLFLLVLNEYAYSSDDPKLTLFVKSRYGA